MVDPDTVESRLDAGVLALGLNLDATARRRLLDYVALLARWNQAYNLTAVREPRAMVERHLLDSLAILPHLQGATLADLGSGAGLPGVPLAIACPALRVWLVESNGKKARFLREVVRSLGLEHVAVVEARAEQAAPTRVQSVVARALAPLAELVRLATPWLAAGGALLAMKGPGHEPELGALPTGWSVAARHRLAVPGLDAERWLVVVKQSAGAAA